MCQASARSAVGAAPFGYTALDAWASIPNSHKHYGAPLAGSIAYFGTVKPGHAVFMVEDGYCYSTDIHRHGHIDKTHYTVFAREWGMPYRGYISWCPSGYLPVQWPQSKPDPIPEEPPVTEAEMDKIAQKVWAYLVATDEDAPKGSPMLPASRALSRSYSQSRKARINSGRLMAWFKGSWAPPGYVSSEDASLYQGLHDGPAPICDCGGPR
jgi:hypothetical protein